MNRVIDKDELSKIIDEEYLKLLSNERKEEKMVDLQSYENLLILENEIMDKYNKLLKLIPRDYIELFKEFDEQVSWLRALESNFTFEEGFKTGMKFFGKGVIVKNK